MHAGIPARPLPARQLGSLFAEEKHQRVVRASGRLQHLQHGPHLVVQRPDLGQIMRIDLAHARIVDAVSGHDELRGVELAGVAPGPGSVRMDAAHEEQERSRIVAGHEFPDARGIVGRPAAHAVDRESRNLLETVDVGVHRMVLARAGHPIAGLLHVVADGPRPEERILVIEPRAMMRRIEPRVHRRPDRNAHRHRSVEIREPDALPADPVDMRRLQIPASVAADFGRKQIVRHDHHDVGPFAPCDGRRRQRQHSCSQDDFSGKQTVHIQ